jgi:hypothetical protein
MYARRHIFRRQGGRVMLSSQLQPFGLEEGVISGRHGNPTVRGATHTHLIGGILALDFGMHAADSRRALKADVSRAIVLRNTPDG